VIEFCFSFNFHYWTCKIVDMNWWIAAFSILSVISCMFVFLLVSMTKDTVLFSCSIFIPRSPKGEGGILFYLCPSILPSVQNIFRRIFLSNCWWQKSDIWSQASYRYTILWVEFLDPSDSYFLFADLVGLYSHWTYTLIFRRIFPSNYWWQKSDIWSQASYRYPISWETFLDPADFYFLFADFVDFYTYLTYICICTFFVAFF
jgi:hypothetical protein